MPKYRFTVEVDTIDELLAQLHLLTDTATNIVARRDADRPAPVVAGKCPQGHGDMRLIPAGTTRSGPRIGQPYPAFLKCQVCGTTQEIAP